MKYPVKFAVGLVSILAFSQLASAENYSCYKFQIADSPDKSASPATRVETWCYRDLSSPSGATLVFSAANIKSELAAVIEADGTVTHGSLLKGNLTTHKINVSDLNPLPVPLNEPANLSASAASAEDIDEAKLEEVLRTLLSSRAESVELTVRDGVYSGSVPPESLPWRGFWWSYKGNMLAGGFSSPLAKYDRFVKARTGVMPRVQSWENTYHKFKGIAWEGHCNGWAASAILRAEPKTSRYHRESGIIFSVGDQKGILAEEDYCATVAFYGKRNNGSGDVRDIYPVDFHNVITYYIGQLGKPVAFDYYSSRSVDNHIISGYTTTLTQISPDTYNVVTALTVHKYDASPTKPPGPAPTYVRTYKYTLKVDAFGKPVGGSWQSPNPDFLWVPLSPLDCPSNNPRMEARFVNEILSLPPVSTP